MRRRSTSPQSPYALTQTSYDSVGRANCAAQRMNPGEFATASLPSDACTLDTQGSYGPDRIVRTGFDNAGRPNLVQTGYGVSGVQADEVATTYTDNGQVATATDAEGHRTTYVYDGFDRLSRTRMPDYATSGSSSTTDYEELSYDAGSGVTSRRLRDGTSIGYSYDNLGRLTARDLPATAWYNIDRRYTYDNLGHLLTAGGNGTISLGWDALGRLTGETSGFGTTGYQYDAAGRRTRLTWIDGFYVTYDRQVTGEVTAIRENGSAALGTYAYDDLGRRTSLTRGNGTSTSYAYDAASRLTQLVQNLNGTASDVTFDYGYNPAGEIVSSTRSNDAYGFVEANANVADTIDGLNRVSVHDGAGVGYDANGNLASMAGASYAYNAENRLVVTSAPTEAIDDSLDRLQRYYDGTANRWFLYDGQEPIVETNATASAITRRYVPGPEGDEPLTWYEGSGTSTPRSFHADERGSVIAVSDSSGNLVGSNPNRYDEYGVPQGALTGRFGYTGQIWLAEAGLYHYRNRDYNPALGRFMQTDPIGFGGGMNIYAYVGGNPVNFTDHRGMDDPDECGGYPCPVVTGSRCPREATTCYSGPFDFDQWDLSVAPIPSGLPPICVGVAMSGNDVTITTPVQFYNSETGQNPDRTHPSSESNASYYLNIFNASSAALGGFSGTIGRYSVNVLMSRGDDGLTAFLSSPLSGRPFSIYQEGELFLSFPTGALARDTVLANHELGHDFGNPHSEDLSDFTLGQPGNIWTETRLERCRAVR